MRLKNYVMSTLKCSKCGNSFSIPRKSSRLREKGHIKHMWCPFCNEKVAFVEFRNFLTNGNGEEIEL